MRIDRRRRDDRFLEWKVRIFSLAAGMVLVGIYLDERWMTGTALMLLVLGMLLRFLPGGGVAAPPADEQDHGEADHSDEPGSDRDGAHGPGADRESV